MGGVALIAPLYWEARSSSPMVPLRLFRTRNFTGTNLLSRLIWPRASFWLNEGHIPPSPVISLNRYNQKLQIRMVVAGQMRHIRAIPAIAAEAL